MLSKKFRVPREEMEMIMKSGKSFHTDFFYAKFLPNKFSFQRFAVVIPIKIEKKSSGRHLLKRRITSVIERFIKNSFQKSFDSVILAKKNSPTLSFSEVALEINKILEHTYKLF